MSLRLAILISATLVFGGCSGDPELFVSIEAGDNIGTIDQLEIEIYKEDSSSPFFRYAVGISGRVLPQTVLLKPGGSSATNVRVHVVALLRTEVVAEGDTFAAFPSSGREEVKVLVRTGCTGLSCARLQGCGDDNQCDLRCTSDIGCQTLGCAQAMSSCRLEGGSNICRGMGADLDADGARDTFCTFDLAANDCDDTSAAAKEGGTRACGAARDHDCNGRVDELELCASSCDSETTSVTASQAYPVGTTTTDTARARLIAAVRPSPEAGSQILITATDTSIATYKLKLLDPTPLPMRIQEEDIGVRVNQVFVWGSVIAAATDGGLLLLRVSADGNLEFLGSELPIPTGRDTHLFAVTGERHGNRDILWVSGDQSVGLAAVDITQPDAPKLLGATAGNSSSSLARVSGGTLAVVAGADNTVLYYPDSSPTDPRPMTPVDLNSTLALMPNVTAIAVQPGRTLTGGGTEGEIVALGFSGTTGTGELRLYERTGTTFMRRATYTGTASIVNIYLDAGVVMMATASGAIRAIVRGPGAGELSSIEGFLPGPSGGVLTSLWGFAPGPTNSPYAVAAIDDQIRYVTFSCN